MKKPPSTPAAKTERCETCKGAGKYEHKYIEHSIASRDAGLPGVEKSMGVHACFTCKGAGVLPLGYQARLKAEHEAFWCKGEGRCASAGSSFFDDGECACCAKHHYHCGACGKVSQVG